MLAQKVLCRRMCWHAPCKACAAHPSALGSSALDSAASGGSALLSLLGHRHLSHDAQGHRCRETHGHCPAYASLRSTLIRQRCTDTALRYVCIMEVNIDLMETHGHCPAYTSSKPA
eukprot:1160460-Pelagomonas_calceolata.AAC.6